MRILVLLFVSIFTLMSCQEKSNSSTLISSKEMKELMVLDSVQLIDVRTLEEFREGHLEGAQNLIYDNEFVQKIEQLDKSKPVAVYCRTGRRSEDCAQILKDAGFKKVYQLKGGLSQWEFKNDIKRDTIL